MNKDQVNEDICPNCDGTLSSVGITNGIETRKCKQCGLKMEFEALKQPPFIPDSIGDSDEFELYFDSEKGSLKDLMSIRKKYASLSSLPVSDIKLKFSNHEKILLGVFLDGFLQDELYSLEKHGLVDEVLTYRRKESE